MVEEHISSENVNLHSAGLGSLIMMNGIYLLNYYQQTK